MPAAPPPLFEKEPQKKAEMERAFLLMGNPPQQQTKKGPSPLQKGPCPRQKNPGVLRKQGLCCPLRQWPQALLQRRSGVGGRPACLPPLNQREPLRRGKPVEVVLPPPPWQKPPLPLEHSCLKPLVLERFLGWAGLLTKPG